MSESTDSAQGLPDITVTMPIHNEIDNIVPLWERIPSTLEGLGRFREAGAGGRRRQRWLGYRAWPYRGR